MNSPLPEIDEPVHIQPTFANGVHVHIDDETIALTFWVDKPVQGDDGNPVVRHESAAVIMLTHTTARELHAQLRQVFAKGARG